METGECVIIEHIIGAVLFRREMEQGNLLSSVVMAKWGGLIGPIEAMGAVCVFPEVMLRFVMVEFECFNVRHVWGRIGGQLSRVCRTG